MTSEPRDEAPEPDDRAPTGLPDDAVEPTPLGHPGNSTESEGADAMPGIPTDGEPQADG